MTSAFLIGEPSKADLEGTLQGHLVRPSALRQDQLYPNHS